MAKKKTLATKQKDHIPYEVPVFRNIDFVENDHDKLVSNEGYPILFEKSIKCPCQEKNHNKIQTSCTNCNGSGWVFVEATNTRAVVQSQGKKLVYGLEGEVLNAGQIMITPMAGVVMTEFDRITLLDATGVVQERPFVFKENNKVIAKFNYIISEIEYLYRFVSTSLPLEKLTEGVDYTIDGNLVYLNVTNFKSADITLSCRYKYNPQYVIVDIPKHVRYIQEETIGGNVETKIYPQLCIARLAHYTYNQTEGTQDNN
jgi:hypothetical protein